MQDDVISFKSSEPYFSREKSGAKNNTVRFVDHNDERFKQLMRWYLDGCEGKTIRIENSKDDQDGFTRDISDISFFNNFAIITWER
ncbi:MAG TPA: hypothetical protein VKE88_02775 [Candidatus Nanoarchaeia archaeon]|nr:hypothetical protein [Candidatus Nanoarchaeia archaeon]